MLKLNRKGQGTTEYIVIIAIAIAILFALWPRINQALRGRGTEAARTIENIGR